MALREHNVIMCWGTLSYSGQGPSQWSFADPCYACKLYGGNYMWTFH